MLVERLTQIQAQLGLIRVLTRKLQQKALGVLNMPASTVMPEVLAVAAPVLVPSAYRAAPEGQAFTMAHTRWAS